MRHGGPSRSATLWRSSKSPEATPGTTPPKDLGKKRNGFQTLPNRRLSPTDIDDLIAAYQAGANISQLAAGLGIHRTTVAAQTTLWGYRA